jgi:hypothetical protein
VSCDDETNVSLEVHRLGVEHNFSMQRLCNAIADRGRFKSVVIIPLANFSLELAAPGFEPALKRLGQS